jgi:hypothetical protein
MKQVREKFWMNSEMSQEWVNQGLINNIYEINDKNNSKINQSQ